MRRLGSARGAVWEGREGVPGKQQGARDGVGVKRAGCSRLVIGDVPAGRILQGGTVESNFIFRHLPQALHHLFTVGGRQRGGGRRAGGWNVAGAGPKAGASRQQFQRRASYRSSRSSASSASLSRARCPGRGTAARRSRPVVVEGWGGKRRALSRLPALVPMLCCPSHLLPCSIHLHLRLSPVSLPHVPAA